MLLPCMFIQAIFDKSVSSGLRDLDDALVAIPFNSLGSVDYHNLLFNEAYFQFYVGMDATAYQYNDSTGQLQKRTLLSWRNHTGDRTLTQPDLDALPDVPTGRVLKTKHNQFISVLDSRGYRHTLQVAFDVSPDYPPVLVELVKNARNWIAVKAGDLGYTALVTKRAKALTQPIFDADGNMVRAIAWIVGSHEGPGGSDYVYVGLEA
jgi:hypothetical protein